MAAHDHPLVLVERGALAEDRGIDEELADVVQVGGAADERALGRVHAHPGRDPPRELGDVLGVVGGVGLLGAKQGEQDLRVALGHERRALLLVLQARLGEREDVERAAAGARNRGGPERAARGRLARAGLEREQHAGAAAPYVVGRAVEEHGEPVAREAEAAAGRQARDPAGEAAQVRVAARVAVLGVEAAEVVDVDGQQQDEPAVAGARDRALEPGHERPRGRRGARRARPRRVGGARTSGA